MNPFPLDIKEAIDRPKDLDQLVDLYDSTLRCLINKPAPLRVRQIQINVLVQQQNIQFAKMHRRYCEKLWITYGLSVHL